MCNKKRKRSMEVNNQKQLNVLMDNDDTSTAMEDDLSTQIQTLTDRRENLDAGLAYILQNENTVQFDDTVRNVETQISAASKKLDLALQRLQELQSKRQNFANRVIHKGQQGGHTGDGNCHVSFVNVGMGDCTVIATPMGRTIMIDCGSDALSDVILDPYYDPNTGLQPEDFIRNTIKNPTFLNGAKVIDILFLTHPDGDHHDKLKPILQPIGVTANIVYYGGADDITGFKSSAYIKEIAGDTAGTLRKVHLCEEPTLNNGEIVVTRTINGSALPYAGQPNVLGNEFVDPLTKAMVVYYEQDPKSDFKISILAGNVTGVWREATFVKKDDLIKGANEPKLDATVPNKRSLMILIECFGKSILVCGDATAVTENFACDYFGILLKKVTYLRMGHHGSTTSSAVRFLDNLTTMQSAVASTGGQITTTHRLPKQAIIDLYPPRVPNTAAAHNIYAFGEIDTISHNYFPGTTHQVFATGSNDTFSITLKQS